MEYHARAGAADGASPSKSLGSTRKARRMYIQYLLRKLLSCWAASSGFTSFFSAPTGVYFLVGFSNMGLEPAEGDSTTVVVK